jgi:hypothetical protein
MLTFYSKDPAFCSKFKKGTEVEVLETPTGGDLRVVQRPKTQPKPAEKKP